MKKDVCITKIEQIWDQGKTNFEVDYLSKALRLLVFYTRTSEGVPLEHIVSVQSKVDFLEKLLPSMDLDDATFAIPAIKYARRQLRVQPDRGNAFKRGLTKAEIEKARRIGNPQILNGVSVAQNLQPTAPYVFSDLDELLPGALDDGDPKMD